MKNSGIIISKFIAILSLLVFVFLTVSAFNPRSASLILGSSARGGVFLEKSIRVFESLLILLVYQSTGAFAILLFGKKLQAEKNVLALNVLAIFNLVICMVVYCYAAVFPWSIPKVD